MDSALAEADRVFSGEFEFSGQEHFYLETHAALAHVDEAGQVFVQSSTQHPSETQEIVAHVLGRHNSEITVQCLRMGGGFGGKEMQPHGFAAIAALGAILTGRPVRLRLNRTQDLTMSGKRHGFHADWRVGFDADGHLLALEATLTADGGWSLDLSEPVLARALCHIDNAYWIPHARINGRIAKTHKTSNTAFRGFGGPQGMLVIEDILGRCAPLLGIDPMELRQRNFYRAGQSTPYGQPVRHPERLQAVWEQTIAGRRRASSASGEIERVQRDPRARQARPGDDAGEVRDLVQPDGVQPGRRARARLQGRIGAHQPRRHRDGPGPAHEDAAGGRDHAGHSARDGCASPRPAPTRCPTPRRPRPAPAPTSTAARSRTPASRSAIGCWRSRAACSGSTPTTSGSSTASRGRCRPPTTTHVDWDELVRTAYFQRVQLSASGFYRTEGLHWDSTVMQGSPFKYFAYGAAATEVEVDGFTGAYRTLRVDIVHDVGDSLSPLIDLGQIEGGFVQGAGWLTLEDLRWDTSDGPGRGRFLTQAASTYKLPSFSEMPETFNVTLLRDATEAGAVYGSKAVGEPPLMLAFSVREALRQAAAAFGPAGTSVNLASPATPEAVFWAIEQARDQAAGDTRGDVIEGFPGRVPPALDSDARADAQLLGALAARGGACLMGPGWTRSSACARRASLGSWSRSPRSAATRRAGRAPRWS